MIIFITIISIIIDIVIIITVTIRPYFLSKSMVEVPLLYTDICYYLY